MGNIVEKQLINLAEQKQIPINAGLEITPICNLHCDMCYVRQEQSTVKQKGGILPLAFWKEVASQLKKAGCFFILLSGGEPLLHPEFKDLYSYLSKEGFSIRINTNGTLITDEIANLFAKNQPRIVNVTLYGANNETYENLCHIKKGYDKCMEGIKKLMVHNIPLCLNLTAVKANQADYKQIIDLAIKNDIPVQVTSYVSVIGNDSDHICRIKEIRNTPYQAAENDLIYQQYHKGEEFPIWLKSQQDYLRSGYYPDIEGCSITCKAGKYSCWITWTGRMQACVDMDTPSFSLREMEVQEAWERIKNAVRELPTHTECKDCKLKPLCNVCYANATNEKKHCGSMDYLCKMAETKANIINSINIEVRERAKGDGMQEN